MDGIRRRFYIAAAMIGIGVILLAILAIQAIH